MILLYTGDRKCSLARALAAPGFVRLERLRRDGRTLKDVVNEALRAGLDALETRGPPGRRDYTSPMDLGKPLVYNIDDVQAVLDLIEGDRRR